MRALSALVYGLASLLMIGQTAFAADPNKARDPMAIRMHWANNYLTVSRSDFPGDVRIMYLEAYCRPGSTDRDWRQTVIGHQTKLVAASDDGREIRLRCVLNDGVTVDHHITAGADEIDFRLSAHNPTQQVSQAHWAQPCIQLAKFIGKGQDDYLGKGFIFVQGKLTRLPCQPWATKARYVPGQVWCPRGVDRNDVNPRPLSSIVPSNGLIGCFSADDKLILASAWEPYQELFQGVIVCLHSDFRLGGLKPGETKKIRGKIYIVANDAEALLKRYEQDFPEHGQSSR